MRIARFVLMIALALAAFAAPATAETRMALVIGNGAYANAPKLPNPPNDATDIAAALRDLGSDGLCAKTLEGSPKCCLPLRIGKEIQTLPRQVGINAFSPHSPDDG